MRLEEEYRRRLHQVTDTVQRRLNYQVDVEKTQRKYEQLHMIRWLEQTVKESVSGKQVRENCIFQRTHDCTGLRQVDCSSMGTHTAPTPHWVQAG